MLCPSPSCWKGLAQQTYWLTGASTGSETSSTSTLEERAAQNPAARHEANPKRLPQGGVFSEALSSVVALKLPPLFREGAVCCSWEGYSFGSMSQS